MSFSDIFKKSFLQTVNTGDVSVKSIIFTMVMTCIMAVYIFAVYRIVTRKTFYNKNFNISLAAVAVIVAAVIMTIQSSIVVSLGMVGALSIVRFRTAVKDPMDLVFMFWAISIGIICGAGLYGIAVASSVVLTIGIVVLNAIPVAKSPLLLILNADNKEIRGEILETISKNTRVYHIKSQTIESGRLDMVIEVRTRDGGGLVDSVSGIDGIMRCSLVSHDGEVTF